MAIFQAYIDLFFHRSGLGTTLASVRATSTTPDTDVPPTPTASMGATLSVRQNITSCQVRSFCSLLLSLSLWVLCVFFCSCCWYLSRSRCCYLWLLLLPFLLLFSQSFYGRYDCLLSFFSSSSSCCYYYFLADVVVGSCCLQFTRYEAAWDSY